MWGIEVFLWAVVLGFVLGSLDDLWIDGVHLFMRRFRRVFVFTHKKYKENSIAVLVPAWQESDVLEAMVRTNLARIQYQNYHWWIGVYPNDTATVNIARLLSKEFPDKISIVLTDRPGPTSKAHCLNQILRKLSEGPSWDWAVIHDAEDVIHPLSFALINEQYDPKYTDFIQLPIFSLPLPLSQWTAGTYLDEFAEVHLKELPVREWLGMPIPSAGVGTFFSHTILTRVHAEFGYTFDENNLTEDYEISQRIAALGGRQSFCLTKDETGEWIATREYFPKELTRSIRQKARWTTGICLQTWKKWGWFTLIRLRQLPARQRFLFLYAWWRDRKGLWSNPLTLFSWSLSLTWLSWMVLAQGQMLRFIEAHPLTNHLLTLNLFFVAVRFVQRTRFTLQISSPQQAALAGARTLLSQLIGISASLSALRNHRAARKSGGQPIRWDKTAHVFPTLEILSAAHPKKSIAEQGPPR